MTPFDPRHTDLLRLAMLFFVIGGLLIGRSAEAAACGARKDVTASLQAHFGPRPHFIALSDDGKVIELWRRADGPWKLVVTSPQGYACIAASGPGPWEALPQGDPV